MATSGHESAVRPTPNPGTLELGRESWLLLPGFDVDYLRPLWWDNELAAAGLGQRVRLEGRDADGHQVLNRSQLFAMAETATSGDTDRLLDFVWHVLLWGSGRARRNNRTRIRGLSPSGRQADGVEHLRRAADHARENRVKDAYATLRRRPRGVLPGLGPAFFTKYLYFVGGGSAAHRCLILDQRVTASLRTLGWKSLTGYNWSTATYVAYCELLSRWAEESSKDLGRTVGPDEWEKVLFEPAFPKGTS